MYFQDLILTLQAFWCKNSCALLQPYDMEVGAGTSSPSTLLRCLGDEPWNVCYVQPSRRPVDGRYGENPNRLQHYYQFQVILKPSPSNIQDLCLNSLYEIGINPDVNDLRFIEDDWENPTLGASGLGWELWCNGMEVLQFTYIQKVGGIACTTISGELTYGLERLAMYIQGVDSLWELKWNKEGLTYRDVFFKAEVEYSGYNFEHANIDMMLRHFRDHEAEALRLINIGLIRPAYDHCLKAAHLFNMLDARGAISVVERAGYIGKIRHIAKLCC